MMKKLFVIVAVLCSTSVMAKGQWRVVAIPDTLSTLTSVERLVSTPDGSILLFSNHMYESSTLSGFRYARWFARLHRLYSDGTIRHLATYSNGSNESEPGSQFSRLSVLNDTIIFQLDDQHDGGRPTRVGVLDMASDSIFVSEVYSRVFYVCDSRRAVVGTWSGGMSTLVDIHTGEVQGTQFVDGEIVGLGPIISRWVDHDSVFIEKACTSESVGLGVPYHPWGPPIYVGQTGTFYLYERDTAASKPIIGISWSTDMGATFSRVLRAGAVRGFCAMADGGQAILSQHTTGPKYRVSFADRYGVPRYGYYIAPDTLRIEAIDARDRDNVALGVNWYDSTHKARVGVAFLDPSLSVTDEYQESRPASWKAYTTIGQYVTGGEGAFDVAVLDHGMYIVVEGGKARLVMKQ